MLESLLTKIELTMEQVEFDEVIANIEHNYDYTPTRFTNGAQVNEPGQNEGSCKIFAFAKLNNLSVQQTLHCFGKYYREDVLAHPQNDDHQNIRQFIEHGWNGVSFDGTALVAKTSA